MSPRAEFSDLPRPQVSGEENAGILPQISEDGRLVSFISQSGNLVQGDTNGSTDVFVRDRQLQVTARVSLGAAEQQPSAVGEYAFSPELGWLGFWSSEPVAPVSPALGPFFYLRQVVSGLTLSRRGFLTDVSRDGRYCGFWRPGTPTHVFLYDRLNDQEINISAGSNGNSTGVRFSPDGELAYFYSEASNLAQGDSNQVGDVFAYRISTSELELLSKHPNGQLFQGKTLPGRFSQDGRYYVFSSEADNIVAGDGNGLADVFLQDRQSGTFTQLSRSELSAGNGPSLQCDISADGQKIVFNSLANNLVPRDTNQISDVFLYTRSNGILGRLSLNDSLREARGGDDRFRDVRISADGNWVAFTSEATNMLAGVSGGYSNVFVTNAVVPTLFTPPGPHADAFGLLLSGDANILKTPFRSDGSIDVSGEIAPSSSNPQLISAILNLAGSPSRRLQLNLVLPSGELQAGTVITPAECPDTEVYYSQTQSLTETYSFKNGSSGSITVISITPGSATSGTVVLRFDDWEMSPDAQANSLATGSFRLNGTITFTIP